MFQAAVLPALTKQNLRKRFNLRSNEKEGLLQHVEEPIDVDHVVHH